jgi:hypothetical protein
MIFSYRNRCNGTKNGEPCGLKKPDFQTYGVPLIKNKDLFKEGDWDCWRFDILPFIQYRICGSILIGGVIPNVASVLVNIFSFLNLCF